MLTVKRLCIAILFCSSYYVALPQPPGKHWEAVAYNRQTKELAVFSGAEFRDNKMFLTDSLWLFNGKWRVIDGNNIAGRWAHALVYHNNSLFTYGGLRLNEQQQETLLNDLHRFNKGSWSKITEGPTLHLPVLNSLDGKLFLSGQSPDDKKNFEVWELTDNNFKRKLTAKLSIETDGARTLVVKNSFVVIYPSDTGLVFQNVTTGVTAVVNDLPKRSKFGIVYNEELGSYFLFGGLDEKRNFSNGLWQIKNGKSTKLNSSAPPSPRASCNLLPTAKGFILYGGAEAGGKLSNSMWHFENGKWIPVTY